MTLRRNGPCPCGSGRKFKKCCLITMKQIETDIRRGAQYTEGPGPCGLIKIKDAPTPEDKLVDGQLRHQADELVQTNERLDG